MEFSQIAILLSVAGVFGMIAKITKQPLIVGYLFAGIILALFGFTKDLTALEGLGQIGVTLLLFLLGLEMKISELPSIGKPALFTGLGQIFFTSGIGFVLALLLGFAVLPAVYIAVALTFSSTIIMVKLLSEKKDLASLYGRIAVGFLLVQDFVAILILMFLSSLGRGDFVLSDYGLLFIKAILLISGVFFLSRKILPIYFEKIVSSSNELLFIVSIAWALGVSYFISEPMGFTLEIGGFLAGIALSNLPEHLQIASKLKPLRDFFLTIFFLILGARLIVGTSFSSIVIPGMILSMFVLVGNPVIVLSIMGVLGYKKRTSFLAGLTVAQISEFSLILMTVGLGLGHVVDREVAIVVLVGIITMTISTYLILGADGVYKKLSGFLDIFERKVTKEEALSLKNKFVDHIILVGCHRTGSRLVKYFAKKETPLLVVDFNPGVFTKLTAENVPVAFGDINDPEIFEVANIAHSRLVISTISNLGDNLTFLEQLTKVKRDPVVIFTAATRSDAIKLYENGATYVTVPEIAAGEHLRHLLASHGIGKKALKRIGGSHYRRIISSLR